MYMRHPISINNFVAPAYHLLVPIAAHGCALRDVSSAPEPAGEEEEEASR